MSTNNKSFSPITFGCGSFVLLGYAIFTCALVLENFYPEISIEYVDRYAWRTATRVAELNKNNPFAIHLVLFYCAFGSIVLSIWFLLLGIFSADARMVTLSYYQKSLVKSSKSRWLVCGLMLPSASLFFGYVFFLLDAISLDSRSVGLYSVSFLSVSYLLVISVVMALGFFFSPMALFLAFQPRSIHLK